MLNRRFLINFLFLSLIVACAVYAFIHYDLLVLFLHRRRAIALIRSFHPYDAFAFIILQIMQVIVAPLPGEISGIIGGYLYGPFLGTIYSTIGLTLGSLLAFAISRRFGLPLVERVVKREFIRKYDYLMEHQGSFVSFLLFLIPGFPKDGLCYILGMSHMRTRTFLLISTTGRLLGTILLTVSGSYARNDQYFTVLILAAVSCIAILTGILYREKFLAKVKRRKNVKTQQLQ